MAKPQKAPIKPLQKEAELPHGSVISPPQPGDSAFSASSDGLTGAEARARLAKYGYNELPEEKSNPLLKFLSYFWGPIPGMIEVAAILSGVVHHWEDFTIILALLLMNAGVGFWEEYQAGNAIAALKAKLALHARVKRDGAWITIAARELVPGDLMRIGIGEIVPADARLKEGDPIEVDQSALTGESLPVDRKAGETVYSGSIVRQGEIDAVVYATGAKTYFGKTAHLVETAHTVSHFQRAVLKIGDFLIFIALALVILILIVAMFRGDKMLTTLQFALVLTVAAVPVAMPAVLSVTMAVGARKLAEKQAIVTHLAAMEELAGIDVLCSDKTGTLTQNKLTLSDPFCVSGISSAEVIRAAALASQSGSQDAIDVAVRGGLKDPHELDAYRQVHFQPFDPVHKRTEAFVQGPDKTEFKVSKGAVQVILQLADDADKVRSAVVEAVDGFASRGFRSLGVARTTDGGQWQFLGVLPLFDPPRVDSKQTIATASQMGIKVKMVTGDQMAIAKEMARQLGLGQNIVDAGILTQMKDQGSDQLEDAIDKADGFAQVFPEHKFELVRILQKEKHIVGMTGDGVNDAPALKQADAGIAVSGATDAARAAADIALLNPGLSVIIDAIKESRKMFQRMNSYAIYRIAETIRVLLFMTLSILVFNFYPVTAVMLVLLAILNEGRFFRSPTIAWNIRTVPRPGTCPWSWALQALWAFRRIRIVRTLLLGRACVPSESRNDSNLNVLETLCGRSPHDFRYANARAILVYTSGAILFWAVLCTQTVATLIAVYGIFMAPIGWRWGLFVWVYALAWFMVNDRVKLEAYKIFDTRGSGWMTAFWEKHMVSPAVK